MPESPKWLICTRRDPEAARLVLQRLRPASANISVEIIQIESSMNELNSAGSSSKEVTMADFVEWTHAMKIGMSLMFIQVCSCEYIVLSEVCNGVYCSQ